MMKLMRPFVSVGAGCVFLLLGASAAQGQKFDNELAPGQWSANASYSRFSAVVDGQLLADEKSPLRNAGDNAHSWGRAQARLSWQPERSLGGMRWSAFVDSQIHIDANGGDVVRRINNGGTGVLGNTYPFSAESIQYRRVGMSASRPVDLGVAGRWNVGGSVFVVDQFKSIDAQGVLRDGAAGALGLQANLAENRLGATSSFIRPDKVLGWGVGLDVSALWGDPSSTYLTASVRDIGPALELKQVLSTEKKINTNTLSFDSNGYVQFAPAITGTYSNQSVQFHIKPELSLEAGYQYRVDQRWVSGLIWHGTRQEINAKLQQAVAGHHLELGVHALANMPVSVSLVVHGTKWSFAWRGDQLSPSQARIWSIAGQFFY